MTDATRAVALVQAVNVIGAEGVDAVLIAANAFNDFLTADTTPKDPQPAVTSAAGKEPAAPAKPTKGSVSKARPATKLVPEDESETPEGKQLAKAALKKVEIPAEEVEPEAEEIEDEDDSSDVEPTGEDGVKLVIAKMLEKNLRKEAVGLLKKYKAASATSVKSNDYAAFIKDAKALIPADEEDGDLTA